MPDQPIAEPRNAVEAASNAGMGSLVARMSSIGPAMEQKLDVAEAPIARTIKAGIARLAGLPKAARDLGAEMQEHVMAMSGSAAGLPPEGYGRETGPDTSTLNLHNAVDDIEAAFSVLGKLVKRAKAAHG